LSILNSNKFKIKKWFTTQKAAEFLSISLEEDITESDLLEFALENPSLINLSINFLESMPGIYGAIVHEEPSDGPIFTDELLDDIYLYGDWDSLKPIDPPSSISTNNVFPQGISANNLITSGLNAGKITYLDFGHSDNITIVSGYWSLPLALIQNRILISREIQKLNDMPIQNTNNSLGIIIKSSEDQFVQLLEYCKPKETHYPHLHESYPDSQKGYRPTPNLPDTCYFAIHKSELITLLQSADADKTKDSKALTHNQTGLLSHSNVTEKLRAINFASIKFWENFDPKDPLTEARPEIIEQYFKEKGFSGRQTDAAMSIIRPDNAPKGPKQKS
jgi:hypothetical protein